MRVLQAPSNIANQSWMLAQGLRAHGHHVQVWQYGAPNYGFSVDRIIDVGQDPATYVRTVFEAIEQDFDIVHFHYARSLVPARGHLPWYWDLPVWRALGKKVVFTFHGSDVRLRSQHLEQDPWSYYRFADVPCDETRIASQLSTIRTYADVMTVGNVLNLAYVPDAVYLPKAIDCQQLRMVGPSNQKRPVVLHAPSRRATKGTDFILEGLQALQKRGLRFDVDIAEGLPHDELIRRCAAADIVVEKVLSGDAGVASLEAMALGKVAVSRVLPEVFEAHPSMPVVSADPDTFITRMEELIRSPQLRDELGQRGREYVETTHDCKVVGRRLSELYEQPPRSANIVFPGWTVPEPQRRLAAWQQKVERTEVANAALRQRIERLNTRVAALEHKLAAATAVDEATASPTDA